MRLQLASVCVLAAALAQVARGDGPPAAISRGAELVARSGIYQDTDRTFISTTTVAVRATPIPRFTIEARYLADVISSASVDVVSAATKGFFEVRHEAEGGLSFRDGKHTATASYVYSIENDWESHTLGAGYSHDLLQHTLTLSAGASLVLNQVGRAGDRNFHKSLTVAGGVLSATMVVTPRDVVQINYTLSYHAGFQASPYRFVYIQDAALSPVPLSAPETDPDQRWRHALTARWNHHAFKDTAIRSHLRGYADDWGIVSLTTGVEYVIGLGDFEADLHLRGYGQRHADFYQPVYSQPARYMTADRELSTFIDGFAGIGARWRRARLGPLGELRIEAKVDAFGFRFFDFPRLQSRAGVIAELGLSLSI